MIHCISELVRSIEQRSAHRIAIVYDIGALVSRVEESEEDFDKISKTIKKELERADITQFEEFKAATIGFLTTMLQIQEKVNFCFYLCSV